MQEGLKSMWKSKAVPNYRKDTDKVWEDNALDLGRISAFGKVNKRNKEKAFEIIDIEECGCLPDCGCKEK
jgi:hypothetical protein